jgi:hypothetical protein
MEVMDGIPSGQVRTLIAIENAFGAAGIEFIGTPEDAPGVRLRMVASADASQFKTSPTSKA